MSVVVENMDVLIRKRGSFKAKVTHFEKYVANLENTYPDKIVSDRVAFLDLETRYERFSQVFDEFELVQNEIEESCDLASVNSQYEERENFNDAYFRLMAKAKSFLADDSIDNVKSSGRSVAGSVATQNTNISQNLVQDFKRVKLPTIEIRTFTGEYGKWLEFRDTYVSLIHENDALSDIQKFHYLRSFLAPKVLEVIASLGFTGTNYEAAWNLIYARYNNNKILIQNHLRGLFTLDKIQEESPSVLRDLADNVDKHIRSLNALGEDTTNWDTLLIYLVSSKLDSMSLKKWESAKGEAKKSLLPDLTKFLRDRANFLESLEQAKPDKKSHSKFRAGMESKYNKQGSSRSFVATGQSCCYCKKEHFIQNCPDFVNLSVNERIQEAKKLRLCLNCLRAGHVLKDCRSIVCKICKFRHNVLLHINREKAAETTAAAAATSSSTTEKEETVNCSFASHKNDGVLLSTAVVRVLGKNNKWFTARALLDPGSQSSFLSRSFVDKLSIPVTKVNINICGLNETESAVSGKVNVKVQSRINDFSLELSCLVIPLVTGSLPNFKVDSQNLNIPANVSLADPTFCTSGPVDMLIGADSFWDLLCVGQIKLGPNGPFLQKSKLGWIVSGKVARLNNLEGTTVCNFVKTEQIDRQLSRFWEIEEGVVRKPQSVEEIACEKHFVDTFSRAANGSFVVSMPLKGSLSQLGESYNAAKKQFLSLERKFERDHEYRDLYRDFVNEYRRLGHMTKVSDPSASQFSFYLPHHGVLKLSSSTTKLRTVFNASAKTTSGCSLNDLLMVGPTIQCELISILLRFRKFQYVLAADIEKMYRMVWIDPSQRCLLRILWRDSPDEDIEVYELNTVTYGTSSAAFLAIRCLYQLGIEFEEVSPLVANTIKNHFYVDDVLTGGDTIEDTLSLANELCKVLKGGGFLLRKWVSNEPSILKEIESADNNGVVDIGCMENNKTLGMRWNGEGDHFFFSIGNQSSSKVTKRIVLSEISQIFDPLGLLSCCVILVKIFLRDLWLEKLDWDDALSQQLYTRYLQIRNDLRFLNNLKIDRKVICKNAKLVELHVFSDASSYALGSCVYIRTIDNHGNIFVKLLCAKSKVAPLKIQTVPRLELMAAVLAARLCEKVRQSMEIEFNSITFWTDSTIVLGWINTSPHLLQVFVANRVNSIQELTNIENWRHVRTQDNPADCVSRGVKPQELLEFEMYWSGPDWLRESIESWPEPLVVSRSNELPELKRVVVANTSTLDSEFIDLSRFSNLTRLERVIAYCIRFINNCRRKEDERLSSSLSCDEISHASLLLARLSQRQSFSEDLVTLSKQGQVSNKSKLIKLHPFLDENGLIRVGGRLNNSDYVYEKKHPIVLCSKHVFTRLLFAREHKRLLHAGPQLLLAVIRENYWPIAGRSLARKVFHQCVICFRNCPKEISPVMGDLPKRRVTPSPPFYVTGVDYAGPFLIKDRQGRGCRTSKAYIAVFVCFATRALHLELVSALTTEAFLATLKRFVGRRGKPAQMYSDNGTNFQGAYNELSKLANFLQNNANSIVEAIENKGISWSFIPASSPHFGGLWESGVRTVKYHLKRVAGNALLTFEDLSTLLIEIEAVLNSRPMSPLSCDPSDLTPLTPSHFLIGRPMESVPDRDYTAVPTNRLSHFQRIQQMKGHFWTRWSLEYISELQKRQKWTTQQGLLEANDLVLVKEDHLPPLQWLLGRIVETHPGKDGVARVATIRTKQGTIRRSFAKICPLPKCIGSNNS